MKGFLRRFFSVGLCLLLLVGQAGVPLLVHGCTEAGTAEASLFAGSDECCGEAEQSAPSDYAYEESGCCFTQTAYVQAHFQGPLSHLKVKAAPQQTALLFPCFLYNGNHVPVVSWPVPCFAHHPVKEPPSGRALLAQIQVLRI